MRLPGVTAGVEQRRRRVKGEGFVSGGSIRPIHKSDFSQMEQWYLAFPRDTKTVVVGNPGVQWSQ